MTFTQTLTQQKQVDLLSPFVASLIIVSFLFYIDEGYYDFRWMADPGSWIVFGIYMVLFFPLQFLIARFLFGKFSTITRMVWMVLISVPVTIGLVLWITS